MAAFPGAAAHVLSARTDEIVASGDLPILATLASFIFVSFLFVAYGTLQRRRHAQALAAAGLPPNWSAFAAWHAERRAARMARELGPRPVLFDVSAGGLSTPGWVAMVPLAVTVQTKETPPPMASPSETTGLPATHGRYSWMPFRRARPPSPPPPPAAEHAASSAPSTDPTSTVSSLQPLPVARPAEIAVLIAMPMPSRKDPAVADLGLHELAGLTLGLTRVALSG